MRSIDSQSRAPIWLGCGALALVLAACSRDSEPPRTARVSAPAVAAEEYPSGTTASSDAERGTTVQVSDELRARCDIPKSAEDAPQFEYDRATLRARGENVLDGVAQCLKEGPLKDGTITLIGRADPRGTEEYNQALGRSRAAAARNYLVERGVPAERIRLVSRGERGARGNDEATWALDRRVDLELGDLTATTTAKAPAKTSTAAEAGSNAPILEGTRLQIETSEAKKEEHPNAMSYSDTAEGAKPVNGGSTTSGSSGTASGSASGSVTVGGSR